jgi:hypothetical protein
MGNAHILALDLILTSILRFVIENKEKIDQMTPEEFKAFATQLKANRKEWLSKYVTVT